MQLRGVVKCPKCGSVYHRALYDFDYISCTKSGCGQDFIKCTGQPWPRNSEPLELAATDAQQPQPKICPRCGGTKNVPGPFGGPATFTCVDCDTSVIRSGVR
jgi:hypothetical protein